MGLALSPLTHWEPATVLHFPIALPGAQKGNRKGEWAALGAPGSRIVGDDPLA